MMSRTTVERLAKKLGAVVLVDRIDGDMEIQVEAPDGKVWSCTGDIHAIAASQNYKAPAAADLWKGILSDMRLGLQTCTITDCDWCNP